MDLGKSIGSRVHSNGKLQLISHVQLVLSLRQYYHHHFPRRKWLCPDWQFHIPWLDSESAGARSQACIGHRTRSGTLLHQRLGGSDQPLSSDVKSQFGCGELETKGCVPERFVYYPPPLWILLMLKAQVTAGPSMQRFLTPSHLTHPSPRRPRIPMSPPPTVQPGLKFFLSPPSVLKSILGQGQEMIGWPTIYIPRQWQILRKISKYTGV